MPTIQSAAFLFTTSPACVYKHKKKRITGVGPAIQFLQMAILLYFLKSMGVFVGTRGHFMPIYIFILQLPPHPSIL